MNERAMLEVDGVVATLTLNRPEQRNALSLELLEGLHERVGELESMSDISVLVMTGIGRSFCAGMDLKEVLIEDGVDWAGRRLLESLARLTIRIRRLPAVVLAAVNGAAIGGGCGLSCVADVSVTHADAGLGFPEVDLGICPAVVSPWLVRKIGIGRARRVLLSGGLMSGSEAYAIGLVDHVAADRAGFEALAGEIAARLAGGGARAMRATRGLLNELDGSLDEALLMRGAALSAEVLATVEAQAALRARLG